MLVTSRGAALVGAVEIGGSVGAELVARADEAAGPGGLPEFGALPPQAEAARHNATASATPSRTPGL